MSVPTTYLTSVKNLAAIFKELQDAQVPPRFTNEFLITLGFKSSTDRAIIGVLKALGFLDQAGVPTERYRSYRNKADGPYILAEAIREAYSDLFLARERAEELSTERVKGILASKIDKGESVIEKMASTFKGLVNAARWDKSEETIPRHVGDAESEDAPVKMPPISQPIDATRLQYHYNIELHLPATKDISIYNAIFKSLKEHIL